MYLIYKKLTGIFLIFISLLISSTTKAQDLDYAFINVTSDMNCLGELLGGVTEVALTDILYREYGNINEAIPLELHQRIKSVEEAIINHSIIESCPTDKLHVTSVFAKQLLQSHFMQTAAVESDLAEQWALFALKEVGSELIKISARGITDGKLTARAAYRAHQMLANAFVKFSTEENLPPRLIYSGRFINEDQLPVAWKSFPIGQISLGILYSDHKNYWITRYHVNILYECLATLDESACNWVLSKLPSEEEHLKKSRESNKVITGNDILGYQKHLLKDSPSEATKENFLEILDSLEVREDCYACNSAYLTGRFDDAITSSPVFAELTLEDILSASEIVDLKAADSSGSTEVKITFTGYITTLFQASLGFEISKILTAVLNGKTEMGSQVEVDQSSTQVSSVKRNAYQMANALLNDKIAAYQTRMPLSQKEANCLALYKEYGMNVFKRHCSGEVSEDRIRFISSVVDRVGFRLDENATNDLIAGIGEANYVTPNDVSSDGAWYCQSDDEEDLEKCIESLNSKK